MIEVVEFMWCDGGRDGEFSGAGGERGVSGELGEEGGECGGCGVSVSMLRQGQIGPRGKGESDRSIRAKPVSREIPMIWTASSRWLWSGSGSSGMESYSVDMPLVT